MIGICCGVFLIFLGGFTVVVHPTAGVLVCVCGVAAVAFDVSNVTCNTPCPDASEETLGSPENA